MEKEYCTQNKGDCATCSLVNYNRDCMNRPLNEAGITGDKESVPNDRAQVKESLLDEAELLRADGDFIGAQQLERQAKGEANGND